MSVTYEASVPVDHGGRLSSKFADSRQEIWRKVSFKLDTETEDRAELLHHGAPGGTSDSGSRQEVGRPGLRAEKFWRIIDQLFRALMSS